MQIVVEKTCIGVHSVIVAETCPAILCTTVEECVKPVGRMTWEALFMPLLG